MKTRWYFGALIVIITLFGLSQDNLMVPNQEIVLEFSNTKVANSNNEIIITKLKKQLKTIGVLKVSVRKVANGNLVISYHSNASISNVKKILTPQVLGVDYASSNSENPLKLPIEQSYNLDVFEIQQTTDTGFGSSGKFLFELKQDYDRFSNPNVNLYAAQITSYNKNIEVAAASKQSKTIAVAINNIPHKIPEGRAGPLT